MTCSPRSTRVRLPRSSRKPKVSINVTTLLTNQRTAVNLEMQQMTASVELIKALGGGWNQSELPTQKQLGR
jgi:outer membrane protein TolC